MRRSLKKRLDEIDRLFAVSQEVASHLVIDEALVLHDLAEFGGSSGLFHLVLFAQALLELCFGQVSPCYGDPAQERALDAAFSHDDPFNPLGHTPA